MDGQAAPRRLDQDRHPIENRLGVRALHSDDPHRRIRIGALRRLDGDPPDRVADLDARTGEPRRETLQLRVPALEGEQRHEVPKTQLEPRKQSG